MPASFPCGLLFCLEVTVLYVLTSTVRSLDRIEIDAHRPNACRVASREAESAESGATLSKLPLLLLATNMCLLLIPIRNGARTPVGGGNKLPQSLVLRKKTCKWSIHSKGFWRWVEANYGVPTTLDYKWKP